VQDAQFARFAEIWIAGISTAASTIYHTRELFWRQRVQIYGTHAHRPWMKRTQVTQFHGENHSFGQPER
jgi:hypothetical protein